MNATPSFPSSSDDSSGMFNNGLLADDMPSTSQVPPSFFFGTPTPQPALPSPQQSFGHFGGRRHSYSDGTPVQSAAPGPSPLGMQPGINFEDLLRFPITAQGWPAPGPNGDDIDDNEDATDNSHPEPPTFDPAGNTPSPFDLSPSAAAAFGFPLNPHAALAAAAVAAAQNAAFVQQQNQLGAAAAAVGMLDHASAHFMAAMAASGFPGGGAGYPLLGLQASQALEPSPGSPMLVSPPTPAATRTARRKQPLHKAKSLTNLATAAGAASPGFPAMASPLLATAGLASPVSPGVAAQRMMQEQHHQQQMMGALAAAGAGGAVNLLYLRAMAAAASAQPPSQMVSPPTSAAAKSPDAAAPPPQATPRPAAADELSTMDVELLRAAKQLAEAQTQPLRGGPDEAAEAAVRDRHRQALAEAALYTQSREAAAAITAAAYATLSPPLTAGKGRCGVSASPTREEEGESSAGQQRATAIAAGTAGVVGMMGRARRGSGVRRRPSGLNLSGLGVSAAGPGTASAPNSARPESPAGLWADDEMGSVGEDGSGGSEEAGGEEGGVGTAMVVGASPLQPAGRVGRVPRRAAVRRGRRGNSGSVVRDASLAPGAGPYDEQPGSPSLPSAATGVVGTAVPGKRTRLVCSSSIGAQLADGRYECGWPGCGKTFSTSGHLSRHARIHLGFKPFECDWPGCSARFARSDNMRNHRKTHDKSPYADNPSESESGTTIVTATAGSGLSGTEGSLPSSPVNDTPVPAATSLLAVPVAAGAEAYPSPLQTPAFRKRQEGAASAMDITPKPALRVSVPQQSESLMAVMAMDPAALSLEMQLGLVDGPTAAAAAEVVDFETFRGFGEGAADSWFGWQHQQQGAEEDEGEDQAMGEAMAEQQEEQQPANAAQFFFAAAPAATARRASEPLAFRKLLRGGWGRKAGAGVGSAPASPTAEEGGGWGEGAGSWMRTDGDGEVKSRGW
ncbi:hypothetical protein HDU96_007738 [Phlyctochytrium bullatum]|nr:hypothetical protein HDU96_007738 [Phlyctochytrium bullatum]